MNRYAIAMIVVAAAIGMAGGYWLGLKSPSRESASSPITMRPPTPAEPAEEPSLAPLQQPPHAIDQMVAEAAEEYGASSYTAAVHAKAEGLWDQEMNASYQNLMKAFPTELQGQLRTTQRAWITFRDEQKLLLESFYDHYRPNGTLWMSDHAANDMIITKRRAEDLSLLSWAKDFCP
jgi:uncharacterized protein YecT (DUF1311 family)